MRFREIITETKWWDNSPTMTLYHGTSSALIPAIQKDGLLPPKDIATYAFDILEEYVPRDRWTDELVEDLNQHAIRMYVRKGDLGSVLYCTTTPDKPSSYAHSNAEHGGEIAYNVWEVACMFAAPPGISYRELKANPPLPPRWKGAKPMVVEMRVPKEWCLYHQDMEALRDRLTKLWAEKSPLVRRFSSLDDLLTDAMADGEEVRVKHPVPPGMITRIFDASPRR